MTSAAYLDSSALLKLVRTEPETADLRSYLRLHPVRVTSALSTFEVRRAARRSGLTAEREKADEVLRGVVLIRLTNDILERAASLDPPHLRSLDALHLATAVRLVAERVVDSLEFVVYDRRLGDAARAAGIDVASPGIG